MKHHQFVLMSRMFHQDFDLEEMTPRDAIYQYIGCLDKIDLDALRSDIKFALDEYKTDEDFERYFIECGAQNFDSKIPIRKVIEDVYRALG